MDISKAMNILFFSIFTKQIQSKVLFLSELIYALVKGVINNISDQTSKCVFPLIWVIKVKLLFLSVFWWNYTSYTALHLYLIKHYVLLMLSKQLAPKYAPYSHKEAVAVLMLMPWLTVCSHPESTIMLECHLISIRALLMPFWSCSLLQSFNCAAKWEEVEQ